MEQRDVNAKRNREQKIRRDRRRADHNKKAEVPESGVKQDHHPPVQLQESSPPISNTPSSDDQKKSKPAEENVDTATLFANLKRETDDIAALTNKKFSKRQVFSNWARYEEKPAEEYDAPTLAPENDFLSLANAPPSQGGTFKFKSEQSWDILSAASLYSEHFTLDLDILSQGLACIPLFKKLDLPENIFSVEEMESMTWHAKESSQKYENIRNSHVAKKKQSDIVKECSDRVISILSMKDDKTEGGISENSVYETVDTDVQENIHPSSEALTFEIIAPDVESDREFSPVTEKPAMISNEIRKKELGETNKIINKQSEHSDTSNLNEISNVLHKTKHINMNNYVSDKVESNASAITSTVEAVNPSVTNSDKVEIIDRKVNKAKNDVKPVTSASLAKLPANIRRDHIVKTEPVKQVEIEDKKKKKNKSAKNITVEDDDLDFLLSLKAPVKDVPSKSGPANGKKSTLDIEDEDDAKLPKLPPALQTDEDLDAWLDSALAD